MDHGVPFLPEIGQLWPAERQLLFDAVIEKKPKVVLEVGAWKGAGSTLIIATALKRLSQGHLFTCEPDHGLFETANKLFSDPSWHPFITLINGTSKETIDYLKIIQAVPDLIFFDGPEDPQVALDDFQALESYVQSRCFFLQHDWENKESKKVALIKPYLEAHKDWSIRTVLRPPESVGLVLAVKK